MSVYDARIRKRQCGMPPRDKAVEVDAASMGHVAMGRLSSKTSVWPGGAWSPRNRMKDGQEIQRARAEGVNGDNHAAQRLDCRANRMRTETRRTPTSRKRTSRHSAPKSFMRFRANSRRFPEFSQPLVTSGSGMSLSESEQVDGSITGRSQGAASRAHLCTRYTRVHGGTSARIRATTSTRTFGV